MIRPDDSRLRDRFLAVFLIMTKCRRLILVTGLALGLCGRGWTTLATEDEDECQVNEVSAEAERKIDRWKSKRHHKTNVLKTLEEGTVYVGTDGKKMWLFTGQESLERARRARPPEEGELRVWFFYLGRGSATLLQNTHRGKSYNYLIDQGHKQSSGTLVRLLNEMKVPHLDGLVITHAHSDHFGGTKAVMKAFEVKRTYVSGYLPKCGGSAERFEPTLKFARSRSPVSVLTDHRPDPAWPGLNPKVFGPPNKYFGLGGKECTDDGTGRFLNENSIVLRIQRGKRVFLFTGDTTPLSFEYLLKKHRKALEADVLLVPHHGTNWSQDFEDAISAKIAVANWDKRP